MEAGLAVSVERLLAVARGDEPADLVLSQARLVNVFTGEIYSTDVAVAGDRIAGLGEGYRARETVDLAGLYLCPGLIDAHVHVESSLVTPVELGRALVARGVTTAVTNPHEIANVLGIPGVRYMLREGARAPASLYVTAPSCVPASNLETSGARLDGADLAELLSDPMVLGLGEMMDFQAVLGGDRRMLGEMRAFAGKVIDGHGPGLSGRALNAYVAAGITSEHECTTAAEASEKLRLGMAVLAREASGARNLRALLPVVTGLNERRFCLCTDDRRPADLLDEGSIDHLVRIAVAEGLDPVVALRMATLNPAERYGLNDRGAITPGRLADLVVFEDPRDFRPERVYRGGALVAQGGEVLLEEEAQEVPPDLRATVRLDWSKVHFEIPARGRRIRVIGVMPNEIVTRHLWEDAKVADGRAWADPDRDLAKLAVIERHGRSGNVGLGFARGTGIRRGAIASTVAHDHHNLVVAGADDRSMMVAARAAAAAGGGLAAACGEEVLARVPLPVAGLMSDQPIRKVRAQCDQLLDAARLLGSALRDPFATLSFLALEVVPSLKLTDLGLVDVDRFELVPLFADP